MLTLTAARKIAGSLGYPSKMPGTSYGLPAQTCITGAKLARIAGSTCSSCYALNRGNYRYSSVKIAQERRLNGIASADWVEAMVRQLVAAHARGTLPPYHRWHDAGDLQSRDHLAKICAVARATPRLSHWLPTRESALVRAFVRDGGTIPSNLIIRLSATMIDGPPPTAWPITSTVHTGRPRDKLGRFQRKPRGHLCPAPTQGNKCGGCRACWSLDVPNVSYHIH